MNTTRIRKLRKPSLIETHPELAKQFHPSKNIGISVYSISASYTEKVIWICEYKHEWMISPRNRTVSKNSGCRECVSFEFTHPILAKEWNKRLNGNLTPDKFKAGSHKIVWWTCPYKHEWQCEIRGRVSGINCQICNYRTSSISNCLAITHPKLTSEWDYELNEVLGVNPNNVTQISRIKANWKCINGHKWAAVIRDRVSRKINCAKCSGRKVTAENCLAVTHPDISSQWHKTNNGDLTPYQVTKGSEKYVWWQCPLVENHEWKAYVYSRTSGRNCPFCNYMSIESVRLFILSLIPYIKIFDPIELYVIFQQNGLLDTYGKSKSFIKDFISGKFPKEDLELVLNDSVKFAELIEQHNDSNLNNNDQLKTIFESDIDVKEKEFPILETKDILASIDNKVIASADAETIDFLIKSAVAKIWRHAFNDEMQAALQLAFYKNDGEYAKEIKRVFLEGYEGAKSLEIPIGYNDSPPFYLPKKENLGLMQRYVAHQIKTKKRFGNWSGTGAGKTLSAILASRIINSKLTVVCCPNNVIDTWKKQIEGSYPDSEIYTKESFFKSVENNLHKHKFLILNYEFFQQIDSEIKLKFLVDNNKIDFIVIDEIHYSKQRVPSKASKRKILISAFLSEASIKNENLCVLGMSATPVINDLFEGKTLIELITGLYHNELHTKPTLENCVSLYKKFVSHGIRYIPNYKTQLNEIIKNIDCSEFIPEIRQQKTYFDLEVILTKAKLPFILEQLRSKTIVYTHYRDGIEYILRDAIIQKGWKVALFNGDTKSGLDKFIDEDIDILIATSCIGTGIDGLQNICHRIIINCLPWTHAEYTQLIGRIYRQGQKSSRVDIIIPLTFSVISEERWSWCDSRWNRILFKESLADAAVDGKFPIGKLRNLTQAYTDMMNWLERIEQKGTHNIERSKITLQLNGDFQQVSIRKISDLTKLNKKINTETSNETHQRLLNTPQDWFEYQTIYREARKEWEVIPYQEAIKWLTKRPDWIVGDFGCGEALLAKELKNKIYSFDHIAINENVISCDMKNVPLTDSSLDAVVFSLSLMGINFIDYLKEAKRCLRLYGYLWIAEPTARINDINVFKDLLYRLGFNVMIIEEKWKFTFIIAVKADREINDEVLKDLIERKILD